MFKIFRKNSSNNSNYLNNNRVIIRNKEYILEEVPSIKGLHINCVGENNTIEILNPDGFIDSAIDIRGNDSKIQIKNIQYLRNTYISMYEGNQQRLCIGDGVTCEGARFFIAEQNAVCIIEDECMLANGIQFWTSDGHSIIDLTTDNIINKTSMPIVIGKRTWIAQDVRILKNTQVACNSIIGAGSIVTKRFTDQNVCIAGNPAKIVKCNVKWDRSIPSLYEKEKANE